MQHMKQVSAVVLTLCPSAFSLGRSLCSSSILPEDCISRSSSLPASPAACLFSPKSSSRPLHRNCSQPTNLMSDRCITGCQSINVYALSEWYHYCVHCREPCSTKPCALAEVGMHEILARKHWVSARERRCVQHMLIGAVDCTYRMAADFAQLHGQIPQVGQIFSTASSEQRPNLHSVHCTSEAGFWGPPYGIRAAPDQHQVD